MALTRILLSDFRNHRATEIADTGQFNLLVGDNGAGKTNVLEALSLLAPGRGLRRAALADIPAHGSEGGFAVSAELAGNVRLGTGIRADRPGRRVVSINQAESPALALGEWLSISWLTPAMDRLFAESAGARRRYLDRLALALDPAHARHAARYENALRERNRLLASTDEPDPEWLDAVTIQTAEAGAALAQGRAALIERLDTSLTALPDGPFARPALSYQPGGPLDQAELTQALRQSRGRDRAAQRTLTGPHRDELEVTMARPKSDGTSRPASECSTGEQKAMLIAITLAHASLLDPARPQVLLLDEVAAHLDPLRREALFERLRAGTAQVWLTGTELAPFSAILAEAAVWQVSSGAVRRGA